MLVFSLLCIPSSAAYEWNNEISVQKEGIVWEYTEKYSDERSVIFKSFIDQEFGDSDGFVSAWEFLKADVKTSNSFYESIQADMDVKIDGSSDNVNLLDVESNMSRELLGPTGEEKDIVNHYQVFYDFSAPLSESDSSMWFKAEPDTPVTINLAPGITLVSVDGVEDESTKEDSYGTHITGNVGFEGEITVNLLVEEPPEETVRENTTLAVNPANEEKTRLSFLEKLFPGLAEKLVA